MKITLNPSQSDTWVKCPGQPLLKLHYPVRTPMNDVQLEGILVARLIDESIKGGVKVLEGRIGKKDADVGIEITHDMVQHVKEFVDYVYSVASRAATVKSEHHVSANINGVTINGKIDVIIIEPDHVTIIDYKYGYRPVSEMTNQLIMYAGMMSRHDDVQHVDQFTLVVYQPRAYSVDGHVRQRTINRKTLETEYAKIIEAVYRADSAKPELKPGTHCRNCSVAAKCEAALDLSTTLFDQFQVTGRAELSGDTTQLARLLDYLAVCQTITNAVKVAAEAEAEALMEKGVSVPGYTFTYGRGRRDWKENVDGEMIEFLTDVDPYTLKTPYAIESAGADKVVIESLTQKYHGKKKLTKLSKGQIMKSFGE
jgi:CRISPR/Cas system-associated exonuclease Cas4 (RecB family)